MLFNYNSNFQLFNVYAYIKVKFLCQNRGSYCKDCIIFVTEMQAIII